MYESKSSHEEIEIRKEEEKDVEDDEEERNMKEEIRGKEMTK